ncbi:hypothetical protein LTR53_005019 [Teratosphaeriaceae sp. CCFEE 6253]|nr:hypothetical protein LTR53_005019 [Teratosphaeriaceae sp. CCFEE 6253]
MSSSICHRCLKSALFPPSSPRFVPTTTAAFSTSAALAANPTKKKAPVGKTLAKAGRTLRLTKNVRVQNARPPAAGERKASRKRVVLANPNALEVVGLEDLTTAIVGDMEKLNEMEGKVLGLGEDTVEALRALEAFKAGQGWSLFRRPAALVRRETVRLGLDLHATKTRKRVTRRVLFGERGSGKSVLLLQGLAMAYLRGHIVLHFPEAREIANAQTAYEPLRVTTEDGQYETIYVQPHYTARLLAAFARANRGVLDSLQILLPHPDVPIPLQSNLSLARLLDLGAQDPQLAYPIWRAFLAEITAPSQLQRTGGLRPAVCVSMDGVDHIMRMSAYLDPDSRPIHAHSLAIARDFVALLSGRTALPNGGVVLAATSVSTRPAVPTLDHFLARGVADAYMQPLRSVRKTLLAQARKTETVQDLDLSSLDDLPTGPAVLAHLPALVARQALHFEEVLTSFRDRPTVPSGALTEALEQIVLKLPAWSGFEAIDAPVAAVMESGVRVVRVGGLTKGEARGVMEYYARSGMMRGSVTEGVVGERWTLAGGGVVGQIEKGAVRARF